MKILKVEKKSLGEEIGLLAGDMIISINGNSIEDKLDFQFYSADTNLNMLIERDLQRFQLKAKRDYDDDLGLTLEALKYRTCGNNCVFCFVYQNPDGLRPSLYIKDEDFRLSFLYGNYTTLTNAKKIDLEKIVAQRLSPQYVSVHATDKEVRKFLLGNKKDDNLLEKLNFLTSNKIEIHGQIVLCPEINDGDILHKTIADLTQFYPMFKSLAIVPVGLTIHRDGLQTLKPVSKEYSSRFITECDSIRAKLELKLGEPFMYLSDEWYIKAEKSIPESSYYSDFYQVENGVGLCRDFIESVEIQSKLFPKSLSSNKQLTLVTALSAGVILKSYLVDSLLNINHLDVDLRILKNNFYGEQITVSGLLTGEDIFNQLSNTKLGDLVVLPPRCLNPDGFFLDNWTLAMLEEKLNKKVIIYPHDLNQVISLLEST
jgi:putative radical SAM enzyme (TIGR03279 family)